MPACKRCDRFDWHTDDQGLCRHCARGIEIVHSMGSPDQPPAAPVHCYAAADDVRHVLPDGKTQMGDLFITSGGVVFVPYWTTDLNPTNSTLTYGLTFGLVGAAVGALNDYDTRNRQLKVAMDKVWAARTEDYGMSVEERISRRAALIIPRDRLRSVASSFEGALSITHDAGCLVLALPSAPACQRLIEDLMAGTPSEEPDRWHHWGLHEAGGGVGVWGLLSSLEVGRPLSEAELAALREADKSLVSKLYATFLSRKTRQQRAIVGGMGRLPAAFREAFCRLLADARPALVRELRKVRIAAAACLPVLLFTLYAAPRIQWASDHGDALSAFSALSVMSLPVAIAMLAFFFWHDRARLRHVDALLGELDHQQAQPAHAADMPAGNAGPAQ